MLDNTAQEYDALVKPEQQKVENYFKRITFEDIVTYKKAIGDKVRRARKTKKPKTDSSLDFFLIVCQMLNNTTETDWTVVEKEIGSKDQIQKFMNYDREQLHPNVANDAEHKLCGFEKKRKNLKMEAVLFIWAKAMVFCKTGNALKLWTQMRALHTILLNN